MTLRYPTSKMVWGLKGQGHKLNECIFTLGLMSINVTLENNTKTNDPKMFKLRAGNDLGMSS